MQELIGYHATDIGNINSILENGFIPSISTAYRSHWLGKGIYFYEDLYYAIEWNYVNIASNKRAYQRLLSECGIIVARIDIENFSLLDLNSGIGYDTYKKIIAKIERICTTQERKELENNGDIEAIRIIEKIENRLEKKLLSAFDVVCAIYPKNVFKKKVSNKGDFLVGIQKQICVKNENAIIKKEEYKFTNNQLENLYNLMIGNRRKKR